MAFVYVDLLISTYNGEKYLAEQLDSLLNQRCQDFTVLIRDDGSTDQTRSILEWYRDKHQDKFQLFGSDENIGPCQSYAKLLECSRSPYVMFVDQDDFWEPDKVERSLQMIQNAEEKYGIETPLLVHSDLKVVDSELNVMHPSFWKYANLNPEYSSELKKLLVQNSVTGCAMICNRACVKLAIPVPQEAIMHDWWMALVASGFGRVIPDFEARILYRQHVSNVLGAKRYGVNLRRRYLKYYAEQTRRKVNQAKAFDQKFRHIMESKSLQILTDYLDLMDDPFIKKRVAMIKEGYLKHGFVRNCGDILFDFLTRWIPARD